MKKPDYSWIRKLGMFSPKEQEAWIRYLEDIDVVGGIGNSKVSDLPGSKEDVNPFREKVRTVLSEIEKLLVAKNEAYGNSALDPVNIFSKSTAVEQIKVRIDDKLSRLYHGEEYGEEDTITDLMGYLTLLRIAEREAEENK